MALEIRNIRGTDRMAVLIFAKRLHEEAPAYNSFTYNETKAQAMVDAFITGGDGLAAFVAEQDGQIAGFISVVTGSLFFSDDKYVTDFVTYVAPKFRGGRAFPQLVARAEEWAIEQGAAVYHPTVSCGIHSERTVGAYQKMGYEIQTYGLRKVLHG